MTLSLSMIVALIELEDVGALDLGDLELGTLGLPDGHRWIHAATQRALKARKLAEVRVGPSSSEAVVSSDDCPRCGGPCELSKELLRSWLCITESGRLVVQAYLLGTRLRP